MVPLTDMKSSKSVGDMVFGDTPNTVLVAIGTRRSCASRDGRRIDLLLTENALDPVPMWKNLVNQGLICDWNLKRNSEKQSTDVIKDTSDSIILVPKTIPS